MQTYSQSVFRVIMPLKIFVADGRRLAVTPRMYPLLQLKWALPPICLLAQCDSSRLLHFRFVARILGTSFFLSFLFELTHAPFVCQC